MTTNKIFSVRYPGAKRPSLLTALNLAEAKMFAEFLGRKRCGDRLPGTVRVSRYLGNPKRIGLSRSVIIQMMKLCSTCG